MGQDEQAESNTPNASRPRLRPLYAAVLSHVVSSYLSSGVFILAGYRLAHDAFNMRPLSTWAKLAAISPMCVPILPAVTLWWERESGINRFTGVFVTWLVAYVALLPATYYAFRRLGVRFRRGSL